MSDELKACPFCGKSDIHIERDGTFFWCECYVCGAISRVHSTLPGVNVLQSEDFARGYWNQRPLEDALHAEIDRRDEELALTEKKLCNVDRSARAEIDRLNAEIKTTDDLLKEATEAIGAVVACCTYNSQDDAKIGIYGIDKKAFTRIDQFITHYNEAVSAGKVSVDVKRELSDAEIEELGAPEPPEAQQ
jgi:hypothetical protein